MTFRARASINICHHMFIFIYDALLPIDTDYDFIMKRRRKAF